jgi:hypothetical protein
MKSMDELKHIFNKMYPKLTTSSKIIVNNLVENKIGKVGIAQPFSGGVDSLHTAISNLKLNPRLIMIWGVEGQSYPQNVNYWENNIELYRKFADEKKLAFNVIKTNVRNVVYERRVEHDFHDILNGESLLMRMSLPFVILGVMAPLSVGRFNRLIISSTVDPSYDYQKRQYSSQPDVDNKFSWADLKVNHFGLVPRFNKISGILKEYMNENDLFFRVCLTHQEVTNCSKCEKCFITILHLALAEIDPNNHGFDVSEKTYKMIKQAIKTQKIRSFALDSYWYHLQKIIPEKIEKDIHSSKGFFEWYKKYEIKEKKNKNMKDRIYINIPFELVPLLDSLYKIGYKIKKIFPQGELKDFIARA